MAERDLPEILRSGFATDEEMIQVCDFQAADLHQRCVLKATGGRWYPWRGAYQWAWVPDGAKAPSPPPLFDVELINDLATLIMENRDAE